MFIICNTEGFIDVPQTTYNIYLNMKGSALIMVDGAGFATTSSIGTYIIPYGKTKYTLKDYNIHAYGKNCTATSRDTSGNCWFNVDKFLANAIKLKN